MIVEEAPTWTEMWDQQGLEKGLKEGRREGEMTMLIRLLEGRFGPLDPSTRARVAQGDADRLLEWGDRFLTARRLEDVFSQRRKT